MKKQTVFVGMSGGVDSSVAALRLQRAGYEVVGVFIKVWHPDWLQCNWEAERLDAMRVAAHLHIPFLTCDAEAAYKQDVADYFISAYQAGSTPNPDVMCNKAVKFGAFLDFALAHGADFIATGHYAQKHTLRGRHTLFRGVDTEKDQSYFLWTLTQTQLQHVLLPVGDTPKHLIRQEATAAQIPTAAKKDSQGVCFLGHIDIPEFLSHYLDLVPGQVVNRSGVVVGEHVGALVYTLGQRHGFTITEQSAQRPQYYVVEKDTKKNILVVDTVPPLVTDQAITLGALHLISESETGSFTCEAQFRYRQTPFPVTVEKRAHSWVVTPQATVEIPASGQSCVLYRGDECLGGGTIL